MIDASEIDVESKIEEPAEKKPFGRVVIDLVRKHPLGASGAAIVITMTLMAIFADYITVYDPVGVKFGDMLMPPDDQYVLGTDQFGRDVLTRLIYGARTALFIGLTAAFLGATMGLILGVTSAYFGGRFDLIFQRVMDVFLAFPLIILALAIVSILGTGVMNLILAIVIVKIALCARVVRSSALAIRMMPYMWTRPGCLATATRGSSSAICCQT